MAEVVEEKKEQPEMDLGTDAYRLAQAVRDWSDEPHKMFRATRRDLLKKFAGPEHGEAPERMGKETINSLYSAASVFSSAMAFDPRANISPKTDVALRPFANKTKLIMDWLLDEADAEDVTEQLIMDAQFGRGIALITLSENKDAGGLTSPEGWRDDPGRPVFKRIAEDMFVLDTSATEEDGPDFMGHRFQLPYEYAKKCGRYDEEWIERIHTGSIQKKLRRASVKAEEDVVPNEPDRFVETVELMVLWLPRTGRLVVLPGDLTLVNKTDEFIRDDKYEGPESGPYEILSFQKVPDSLFPVPPMTMARELADAVNVIIDKIILNIKSEADVPVVDPGAEEMGRAFSTIPERGYITGNPKSISVLKRGGVSPQVWQNLTQTRDTLNSIMGNPAVIGGTGQQAGTLGQEEMIYNNASMSITSKRKKISRMMSKVIRKMAWWVWNDSEKGIEKTLTYRCSGRDYRLKWTPDKREGDFGDYNFEISSYSAASDDPNAQFGKLMQWITQVVQPFAQLGMVTGQQLDIPLLVRETGRLLEVHYAEDLYKEVPMQPASTDAPQSRGTEVKGVASPPKGEGGRPGTPVRKSPNDVKAPQSAPPQALTGAAR